MIKFIIPLITLLFVNSSKAQETEGSFMPEPGKYIVSAWVKEGENQTQQITYSKSFIRIDIEGINPSFTTVELYPTNTIIDGWQRIAGLIEIPQFTFSNNDIPTITVALICSDSSEFDCYFDDVRFYPYNGNMKSFVYDQQTQKLMAELDENNYATFYEYDKEGGLIRVKKETEKGVFTINETRSSTSKKQ